MILESLECFDKIFVKICKSFVGFFLFAFSCFLHMILIWFMRVKRLLKIVWLSKLFLPLALWPNLVCTGWNVKLFDFSLTNWIICYQRTGNDIGWIGPPGLLWNLYVDFQWGEVQEPKKVPHFPTFKISPISIRVSESLNW